MTHDSTRPHGATFAEALDEAIRVSGSSVPALRRRLEARGTPASEAALRSWRSGERRPEHTASLEAVETLEDLLGLGPGSLTSRLGPSRRLRRSPQASYDDLAGVPGALAPLLEAIGCADLDELESLGGTLVVDIGADRHIRATSTRVLWRARTEGARRTHIVFAYDEPLAEPLSARAVGAEIGRSAYDAEAGISAWEIVLPRPLSVGETAMVEWAYSDVVHDTEVTYIEGLADRRVEEAGVWLRFEGDVPAHLEWYEDSDKGCTSQVVRPAGGSVTHHVRGFGPGAFGFRWTW